MKYAIIADIHGNLEAFQVVLEDIRAQQATHIVCLGDVVGYNANPKECLKIVRDMNIPCVKGNHDEYCSTNDHLEGFNPHAADAVHWTRNQLDDEEKKWLRELKYSRMAANFTMVHATLDAPERWGYVFDKLAAAASFPYQNTQMCFFGHTHVPVAFMRDTVVRGGTYSKFKVDQSKKYFINVGAVGQPRDNNPKCAYVIYDMDASTIELRRLEYDIETAQRKILEAGLPERLAERLAYGPLKILILKPSSLGDVVQALPVLRLLKQQYPQAEIFWWIDSALAPLIAGDPDLAGIIRFERRRWGKIRNWPEMFRSLAGMRAQQFDLVIDLQCLLRSGIFAWLSNGKFLAGLDESREGANAFYDLAVPRAGFHTHAVDWYLAVLPRLGVRVHSNYTWLPPRPEIAAVVKNKWPVASTGWIALQPGARWDNKRWPVKNFSQLVRLLAARFPEMRFAILGSQEDQTLGETVASAAPDRCLNLCGATTLPEMIEWLRLSRLLITNDTGPMHVAAALGKPLVALFGPTEPRRTGPYGQLENVLRIELPCAPCLKPECHFEKREECLRAIAPETVLEKAGQLLSH